MASIRRIASGWQAQIARNRVRKSKTFPTKREAQDWGARQEHQILSGEGEYDSGTFGDILKRYGKHESPKKRGGRWEDIRLNKIARDKIGAVRIQDLAASDLADWRDRRLLDVSPVSVRREMQLLSAVLNVAVKEWGLLRKSPMSSVAKPKKPPPRSRLVMDDEIARMVAVAGADLTFIKARSVHAFRFYCATAMRAGEALSLTSESVQGRVATLVTSKTGKGR